MSYLLKRTDTLNAIYNSLYFDPVPPQQSASALHSARDLRLAADWRTEFTKSAAPADWADWVHGPGVGPRWAEI